MDIWCLRPGEGLCRCNDVRRCNEISSWCSWDISFPRTNKKLYKPFPTMTSLCSTVLLCVTSKRRRSAGTLSPTDRQTVSPGTSSLASRCSRFPSLTLRHSMTSFTWSNPAVADEYDREVINILLIERLRKTNTAEPLMCDVSFRPAVTGSAQWCVCVCVWAAVRSPCCCLKCKSRHDEFVWRNIFSLWIVSINVQVSVWENTPPLKSLSLFFFCGTKDEEKWKSTS